MSDRVQFFHGIGSRYSYLASTQVAALERDTGCTVEWIPINSTLLLARRGASPFVGDPVSGQYDWAYREEDGKRWAAYYGVPFHEPRGRVTFDPQLVALAAVAGARLGKAPELCRALFSAMFAEASVTLIDEAECLRRASACGIPDFGRALQDPATAQAHERHLARALDLGVFGVPTFVAGEEIFWGNDRLVLLRHHLRNR